MLIHAHTSVFLLLPTYPQVCSRLEELMRAEREMEAAMRAMRSRRMRQLRGPSREGAMG